MEPRSAMSPTAPALTLTLVTVMALVAGSCGGNDGPDPTGPGEGTPEASRLVVAPIGPQMAGVPFDVTVILTDAEGSPVAAEAASTVSLAVETGDGTLDGPASASLAAGRRGRGLHRERRRDGTYPAHRRGGCALAELVTGR